MDHKTDRVHELTYLLLKFKENKQVTAEIDYSVTREQNNQFTKIFDGIKVSIDAFKTE